MLEDLKLRVMNCAKSAQREGLCKHKSGNLSMKDEETNYIVVTPTSKDREDLVVDDLIVMDLDANVIENKTGLKPTSEVLMHIEIYKTRPDVKAIVHTHSKYATVFAILNQPIPAIVYEMMYLNTTNGEIPVAKYARPGTQELAESVKEVCKQSDGFLLQSHGVVAVDSNSIEDAYLKANYIEEIAELYQHTLAIAQGKTIPVLESSELQKWAYPSEIKFKK